MPDSSPSFKIFRSADSVFVESSDSPGLFHHLEPGFSFDDLFTSSDPSGYVAAAYAKGSEGVSFDPDIAYQPPIGRQEIWAAGVTYARGRKARMEEAEDAGGDVFYDRVYEADRPELFFKATAARARGHRDQVAIRIDSDWDVPEPELTLAITSAGKIFGYTIGNDMSSRSIEGENPLYLPQAKLYEGSCAIGPCLVVGRLPGDESTISMDVQRDSESVFAGKTSLAQLKREPGELAAWLFRSNSFPRGAYLMTGTGIVPDSNFSLREEDEIAISVDGAGTLVNAVEVV